ncbi:hypothetical protein BH11GEM2_BH11GEM2_38690 [soil metagenome]
MSQRRCIAHLTLSNPSGRLCIIRLRVAGVGLPKNDELLHRAMQQSADHMCAMTTQMKGLMEKMQTMMKDEQLMKDHVMQHDLDDMQTHMGAMSRDMGKMVLTMELVLKRMDTAAPRRKTP